MSIIELFDSIYVGDSGCKGIVIDSWNSVLKIQVTCISSIKGSLWTYRDAADLQDGYISFEGVESVIFLPPGPIPNDSINELRAEKIDQDGVKFRVQVYVDSVDGDGNHTEVEITFIASNAYLESSSGDRVT